jgi:capsular exopolysaccharide synthesis family protein
MTSDPAVRTLLVTSAVAGEGKSTTAANLALSFAQLGRRVVLIDADLRRPMVHHMFHLDNRQGLTALLQGDAVWSAMLHDTSLENLKILPTGGTPHNPTELLSTRRMHTLLEHLKSVFDLVIVDSPVLLSIMDVAILAPQVDWTLLVHYPARADRATVMEAKRLLDRASANLLGIVFNNIRHSEQTYYHTVPDGGYGSAKPVRSRQPDAAFVDMRPNETQGTWVINPTDAPPEDDATDTPRTKA